MGTADYVSSKIIPIIDSVSGFSRVYSCAEMRTPLMLVLELRSFDRGAGLRHPKAVPTIDLVGTLIDDRGTELAVFDVHGKGSGLTRRRPKAPRRPVTGARMRHKPTLAIQAAGYAVGDYLAANR